MSDEVDTAITVSGSENAHSHNPTVHEREVRADRHPVAVYLASLRPGSRRSTAGALRIVAGVLGIELELVPWHQLRYAHTQAVRAAVSERYAPATANKLLAALRGVLRTARRLGLMSAEDCTGAVDVRNVKGSRAPRGRAVERDELRRLRAACRRSTALGARDAALLAVMYGGGLRRSEVVGLDVVDVVNGTDLRVRGKGGKARTVYLGPEHARELAAWQKRRGEAPGPLLCAVTRWGTVAVRRLTDQAVLVALRRLAARAGVASFSPHDMRRTYVSGLLEAGADITTVAHLAGHSQVSTTARYDRRGERAARAASELLPSLAPQVDPVDPGPGASGRAGTTTARRGKQVRPSSRSPASKHRKKKAK